MYIFGKNACFFKKISFTNFISVVWYSFSFKNCKKIYIFQRHWCIDVRIINGGNKAEEEDDEEDDDDVGSLDIADLD